jgi:gamma-glutamyltranspeptidase/glutathione hydrolase
LKKLKKKLPKKKKNVAKVFSRRLSHPKDPVAESDLESLVPASTAPRLDMLKPPAPSLLSRHFTTLTVLFMLLVMASLAYWLDGVNNNNNNDNNESVVYEHAAVSTTHVLATREALRCLEEGGNAVDAAAVAQFVLGVVQPQSTGIGGGFFALIGTSLSSSYPSSSSSSSGDSVLFLDAREEAPEGSTSTLFCKDEACARDSRCAACPGGEVLPFYPDRCTGGAAVAVPGVVRGVARLLAEHGTWSLKQTLEPAIKLAEEGFPMSLDLHNKITANAARLALFNSSAEIFLTRSPQGQWIPKVPVGGILTNKDLAATYRLIAERGPDVMYTGEVAADIVRAATAPSPITGRRGTLTARDLARYRPVYRTPTVMQFGPWKVYGAPPPSAGGVSLAQMLAFFNHTSPTSTTTSSSSFSDVGVLARLANAQNAAFADRSKYVGDADWVDVPTVALTDKAYLETRARAIFGPAGSPAGDRAVPLPVAPGAPRGASRSALEAGTEPLSAHSGTTHLSVMDSFGLTVAWTTTIEENLGNGVVVPGRGFLLNNEMTDFTGSPVDQDGKPLANRPQGGAGRPRRTAVGSGDAATAGGKRPRSSMSPTLVVDSATGKAVVATGSPGGDKITGQVMNVLARLLMTPRDRWHLELTRATRAPRVIGRNLDLLLVEESILSDPVLSKALVQRGFNLTSNDKDQAGHIRPLGYVQSVVRTKQGFVAVADAARLETASAAGF